MTPPTRADYRLFSHHPTRWSDNDVYGHLNNVVYYSLCDTAVNQALIGAGVLDPSAGAVIGLVVESGCRYHAALSYPEIVEVGMRVGRLGTSSVRYEVGLFSAESDVAAADVHFVHVYVDRVTRRPVPLPGPLRAFLEPLAQIGQS